MNQNGYKYEEGSFYKGFYKLDDGDIGYKEIGYEETYEWNYKLIYKRYHIK